MQYPLTMPLCSLASALVSVTLLSACGGGSDESGEVISSATSIPPETSGTRTDADTTHSLAASPVSTPASTSATLTRAIFKPRGATVSSPTGAKLIAASTSFNTVSSGHVAADDSSANFVELSSAVIRMGASSKHAAAATTEAAPSLSTVRRIADASLPSTTIWNESETTQSSLTVASGNGFSTTASSASLLATPATGIFYGYRTAIEDWAGLAQRYATDAAVANWVKAEMGRVDEWIGHKFERSDLIGGWIHDYIDPSTGLALNWTTNSPEPAAGTTDTQRKFKAAWVAYGRGYNIRQMLAAARIFRLTGDMKYADWVAGQLDFYATNYPLWPLQTKEGRSKLYAQGLDEAVDTFALLDAARLLAGRYPEARITRWRDSLFIPMAENLKSSISPLTNVALWHQAAIAAIAMRYNRPSMLDLAQNGTQGIRAILAACVTVDNLWIEGSFEYNNYVVNVLGKLLDQASLEGYAGRFSQEREQAIKLLLAPLDYRFDNNTLPSPSDSMSPVAPVSATAHWQLYRVAPTYWGIERALSVRSWESLLDPPLRVSSTAPAIPTAVTRNFPSMGQAVLRSGSWQAYVHYGQSNGSHYQEEMTTFELHEGSTPIAVDPGTVNYGSPYHANYFRLGPAQNVPLINGAGQSKWSLGSTQLFTPSENRLIVSQPKYQTDAAVTRAYRVTANGFVEKSTLSVPSAATKRLGVVFNTACSISVNTGTVPTTGIAALPGTAPFSYWKSVSTYSSANGIWSAVLTCGNKRYSYSVTGTPGQRIYIGKAPNTPMPSERSAIYYDVDGKSAAFDAEIRALPSTN